MDRLAEAENGFAVFLENLASGKVKKDDLQIGLLATQALALLSIAQDVRGLRREIREEIDSAITRRRNTFS